MNALQKLRESLPSDQYETIVTGAEAFFNEHSQFRNSHDRGMARLSFLDGMAWALTTCEKIEPRDPSTPPVCDDPGMEYVQAQALEPGDVIETPGPFGANVKRLVKAVEVLGSTCRLTVQVRDDEDGPRFCFSAPDHWIKRAKSREGAK